MKGYGCMVLKREGLIKLCTGLFRAFKGMLIRMCWWIGIDKARNKQILGTLTMDKSGQSRI